MAKILDTTGLRSPGDDHSDWGTTGAFTTGGGRAQTAASSRRVTFDDLDDDDDDDEEDGSYDAPTGRGRGGGCAHTQLPRIR